MFLTVYEVSLPQVLIYLSYGIVILQLYILNNKNLIKICTCTEDLLARKLYETVFMEWRYFHYNFSNSYGYQVNIIDVRT